jgi:hypothetical protein
MSTFQNIVGTAIEQLNTFYTTQLELTNKSLDNYDEHVETASNLKKNDIDECCNDALEDLKYKLKDIQDDFDKQVNNRIEKSRKHLKEKHNYFNTENGNVAGQFHSDVQVLISETQNIMLTRVANLHNELDLDDNFLNGYGKFKSHNHTDEPVKDEHNDHTHDMEKCSCENCECDDCECDDCKCEDCDCKHSVVEDPVEEVVEEPVEVVEDVAEVVEDVAEVVEDVAEVEEPVEVVVEEEVVEEVVEEPVVEEPVVEEVVEEPVVEEVVDEPVEGVFLN